jgi:hypothetical protein
MKRCALFLLLLAFTCFSFSQQPSQKIVKDPEAVRIVHQAIAALGGEVAVQALQSMETAGTITRDTGEAQSFRWKDKFAGDRFETRKETMSGGRTAVFVSGHGHPKHLAATGKVGALSTHVAIAMAPFYNPAVVLWRAVDSPTTSVKMMDSAPENGLIHIRIRDERSIETRAVTQQDWFINPQSTLPISVQYFTPEVRNGLEGITSTCRLGQFDHVEGVLVPMILDLSDRDGRAQVHITSMKFNSVISDSQFDLAGEEATQ